MDQGFKVSSRSDGYGIQAVLIALAIACAACAPLPKAEAIEAVCSVTDGDTLRCGEERIRLLAIDAPELPQHCRKGRGCAPGDPAASTRSLQAAMKNGQLWIIRLGEDRYGRTLALVQAGETDLSCHQLANGSAIYKPNWDNQQAVHRTCPAIAKR